VNINRYITTTGHIREAVVECNLTTLCLQYLTFDCFAPDTDDQRLGHLALKGHFAFQDYAVAKWGYHLRAVIDIGQQLLLSGSDNATALNDIGDALDDFTIMYEEETLHQSIDEPAKEACAIFENCIFHDSLLSAWSHIFRHQQRGPESRNEVSLSSLAKTLKRNREILEKILPSRTSTGNDLAPSLDEMYGIKRFKCPRVTCHYFHEGFRDSASRETHITRHDRPFNCTVTDCLGSETGFLANKDLEKHMRAYHFELCNLAETFASKKVMPTATPYACPICDKRFTRKFHQDSHVRSHNGVRPYACDECGKAFTRSNDMRRHKKIHARR
jgi:hypothetical protein